MNGRNRTRGRSHNRPSRNHGKSNGQKPNKSLGQKVSAWFKGLFKSKEPQVPITTCRLYVGNLSYKAEQKDLNEFFSKAGRVKTAEVIYDRGSHRSKGFGFVEMETVEEAQKAARQFHNKEMLGRKLIVSGAKAEGERNQDRRPTQHQEEEISPA